MSTTLTNIHSRTALPASLIVAATEIGGAVLLGAFLLAESTPLVVALLAVMGALFAAAIVATVFGFLLGIPSMRTRDS